MEKPFTCTATRELATVNDIVEAVATSDGWNDIQQNDPQISAAEKVFDTTIEGCANEGAVYDAALALVGAYADAAILYGIHVANAIRSVSADPMALSRYIMERRGATA